MKLTKILNLFKSYYSYLISNVTKNTVRYGHPISISVEPTTNCNLKCPQCPVGIGNLKRYKGDISIVLFKKIIDQTAPYLLNIFLYFQGEPFLNSNIFRLIKYANSKNIYTSTSTNGHFFTIENCKKIIDSKLDKLIISLDGASQDVYEKYRVDGNLNSVISGIKNLVETKKMRNSKIPFIELQFLVLKSNEHQIDKIKHLSKNLKVNKLSIKTAQVYNFENDKLFIPQNLKYTRYKKVDNRWILKKKLKNKCWRLWNSTVITWDGEVLPCCFDKDAKYSFGNINEQKLSEIIKNDKFMKFANKLLTNRKGIDICSNCSE
ncbi:MAG: radical SAM/SPASM domain-containing protein [Bacteroidota bacterium]|nr:radical SAM/SPASM domain-containing protein [Bacteroidota bacterium]